MAAKALFEDIHLFAFDRYSKEQLELLDFMQHWLHAFVTKDLDFLRTNTSQTAARLLPAGKVRRYEEDFERIQDPDLKLSSFTLQAPILMVRGDQGFFGGMIHAKGVKKGKAKIFSANAAIPLKKTESGWQVSGEAL